MKNWNNFVEDFSKNILPIYEKHENTFDNVGIHGRLHISRSIIFAEFMSIFYHNELKINIDFNAIRYAVAFHDSGRQTNGVDKWEKDSSELCYLHMVRNYYPDYSKYVSSLILKKQNSDINNDIVYDSDVLEIMRPCCGHGERDCFNSNYLRFLKNNHEYKEIRYDLIEDAWKLIEYTEDNKDMFKDNHLNRLLDIINILDFRILKIS
jgi:hypothetical protein